MALIVIKIYGKSIREEGDTAETMAKKSYSSFTFLRLQQKNVGHCSQIVGLQDGHLLASSPHVSTIDPLASLKNSSVKFIVICTRMVRYRLCLEQEAKPATLKCTCFDGQ